MSGSISEDTRLILEPELQAGEKLLWASRSVKQYDFSIIVGLIAAGLILWFAAPSVYADIVKSWQQPSYGVYFLSFLLGGALWWMVRASLLPGHEYYGLTDRHLIVKKNLFPTQVSMIPIEELQKVSIKKARHNNVIGDDDRNQTGDIYIMLKRTERSFFKPFFRARHAGTIPLFTLPFISIQALVLKSVPDPEMFLNELKVLNAQPINEGKEGSITGRGP